MIDKLFSKIFDFERHPIRSFIFGIPFLCVFPLIIAYALLLTIFDFSELTKEDTHAEKK